MGYWANGSVRRAGGQYAPAAMTGGTADLWDLSPTGSNEHDLLRSGVEPCKQRRLARGRRRGLDECYRLRCQGMGAGGKRRHGRICRSGIQLFVQDGTPVGLSRSCPASPTLTKLFQGSQQPRFVDMSASGIPYGCRSGIVESGLAAGGTYPQAVYDSGCFSYANELGNGQATNGLDDSPLMAPASSML